MEILWRKFEIIYEEDCNNVINFMKTYKILTPLCLLKLKTGEVISMGNINQRLGKCGCRDSISFNNILEYCNLELEE